MDFKEEFELKLAEVNMPELEELFLFFYLAGYDKGYNDYAMRQL